MKVRMLGELYRRLITSSEYKPILDPAKPVNDQIENLPYDVRYEIPKHLLQQGKPLGEGQFGKVFESFLTVPNRAESILVAVKQPKSILSEL